MIAEDYLALIKSLIVQCPIPIMRITDRCHVYLVDIRYEFLCWNNKDKD